MRAKALRFKDGDRKVRVTFSYDGGRCRANAFWGWGSESDVAFITETGPTKDVAAKRMTETLKVKGFELERKATQ